MVQMTLRVPEELQRRIRSRATEKGVSINEFATSVLDAATNPSLAGSEAERTRERLAAAGLLAGWHEPAPEPPPESVVAAAREAAGRGKPLSDFVSEGRG